MIGSNDLTRIIYHDNRDQFENLIYRKNAAELEEALNFSLQHEKYKNYALKLIQSGAELNTPDKNGQLPLLTLLKNIHNYTLPRDYVSLMDAMINRRINLNVTDRFGRNILMTICDFKILPLIETVVKGGLDVNARTKSGETAFFRASTIASLDVMNRLKELNADINLPNNNGQTPLILSITGHDIRVTDWLLKNGADVNAKDIQGNTALMYAIATNQQEIVEKLLTYQAQTHIINKFSHSPVQLALRIKNKNIVRLIQNRNNAVKAKTRLKRVPEKE